MDKVLAAKLGVKDGVSRFKALDDTGELPFAFIPNGGDPLMVISKKALTAGKAQSEIKAAGVNNADTSICYVGRIRKNDQKQAVLHLDPDLCKGATNETMLLKGVRGIGKELGFSTLKGAVLPSIETSDSIKTGKHLVEKGTFARINSDIGKLTEVTDDAELTVRIDKLVRHMKDWQDEHDGSDSAKAQAKRDKIAELEASLWPKLDALLGDQKDPDFSSQAVIDYARRMTARDLQSFNQLGLDTTDKAFEAQSDRLARWGKILKDNSIATAIQNKKQAIEDHRDTQHQQARDDQALKAREEMRETNKLRHKLEEKDQLPDDTLAERLEKAVLALLDTSASDDNGRLKAAKHHIDLLQKKAKADRDKVARDRLARIEKAIRVQKQINDDGACFEAIQSDGKSGSYVILGANGAKEQVFKPMHQEFHTEYEGHGYDGDLSGANTRGEVLGYELSKSLEAQLGISIGVPKTQLARLNTPKVGGFGKFEPRSRMGGDKAQLGSMQEYAQNVVGNPNDWRKVKHPDLPWLVGQAKLGIHDLVTNAKAVVGQNRGLLDAYLRQRFPDYDTRDQAGKENCENIVIHEATAEGEMYWDVPNTVDDDAMTEEVMKIAVFDMISLQSDRNDGNLLLQQDPNGGDLKVIPIDQGDSFPSLDHLKEQLGMSSAFAAWQKLPFNGKPIADPLKTSLLNLDPDEVGHDSLEISRQIAEESGGQLKPLNAEQVGLQRLSVRVLQKGVQQGLTVKEISELYQNDRSAGGPSDSTPPMVQILNELQKSKNDGLIQLCVANLADPAVKAKLKELDALKTKDLQKLAADLAKATNQTRKNTLQKQIDDLKPLQDEELFVRYSQEAWLEANLPSADVDQLRADLFDSTKLDALVTKHVP